MKKQVVILFVVLVLSNSFCLSFSGEGSGTAEDPYQINKLLHIIEIHEDLSAYYILVSDINADHLETWTDFPDFQPIGNAPDSVFTGSIDGQGYAIKLLHIYRPDEDYAGLIGINNGTIKNIRMISCLVIGSNYTGGLCGLNYGKISDCSFLGEVEGRNYVGGLCGKNLNTIKRGYALGQVTGSGFVGGFVGLLEDKAAIENCFSKCVVTGKNIVGGFCGQTTSSKEIKYCYSVSSVTGKSSTGAFCGSEPSGYNHFTCNFWDRDYAEPETGLGSGDTQGITGKVEIDMKMLATFEDCGWDFGNTWEIIEGEEYPYLMAFPTQDQISNWITKNGLLLSKMKLNNIMLIRYSNDGKYLYTYGSDVRYRKWDVSTGHVLYEKFFYFDYIRETFTGDICPNGQIFAFSYKADFFKGAFVSVYDIRQSRYISSTSPFKGFDEMFLDGRKIDYNVLFQNDRTLLIGSGYGMRGGWAGSDSRGGYLFSYDVTTGEVKNELSEMYIRSLSLSANKCFLSFCESKYFERIFDPTDYEYGQYFGVKILDSTFSEISSIENSYRLYDSDNHTPEHIDRYLNSVVSNDARYFLTWTWENILFLFDTQKTELIATFKPYGNREEYRPYDMAFLPNNKYFITASKINPDESSIIIRDIETLAIVDSINFRELSNPIKFAVSNDTEQFAFNKEGAIHVYRPKALSKTMKCWFQADSCMIALGDSLRFHDFTNAAVDSQHWDFGDGTTSTLEKPFHTYQDTGTFTVRLIVEGENKKDTLTKTNYIRVVPTLAPEFVADIREGKYPLEVEFIDRTIGNANSWYWEFGDSTRSWEQNPVHTYDKAGKYNVTLTVTDEYFQKSIKKEGYIKVLGEPVTCCELVFEEDIYREYSQMGLSGFQTTDGNFFIHSMDYTATYSDQLEYNLYTYHSSNLLEINEQGLEVKSQKFSDSAWWPNYIRKDLNEGFYQIVKFINPENNTQDILVRKYNNHGELIWTGIYGVPESNDYCGDIASTHDGGFILIAYNYDKKLSVIKADSNGHVEWQEYFVESGWGEPTLYRPRILTMKDGSYAIYTYAFSEHTKLLVLDKSGNLKWETSFHSGGYFILRDFIRTSDGGFILIGNDFWHNSQIFQTDSSGQHFWSYKSHSSNKLNSIDRINDSLFVIGCKFNRNPGFLIIDEQQRMKEYKFNDRRGIFNSVHVTDDKKLFLVGELHTSDTTSKVYYALTEPIDELILGVDRKTGDIEMSCYPNPSFGEFNVSYSIENASKVRLSVHNSFGSEIAIIFNGFIEAGNYINTYSPGNLPSGIYYVRLLTNGNTSTKKLVIVK